MRLADWMRQEGLSDADVAAAAGISEEAVRKIRFRVRGASARVAGHIHRLSAGNVPPNELVALKRRAVSVPPETRA